MTLAQQTVSRIAGWLPESRWFADKSAALERIAVQESIPLSATGLALTLLDVRTSGQGEARYVAPIDLESASDAAFSAGFAGWLIETVLGGHSIAGRQGRLVGHAIGKTSLAAGSAVAVRPLGGDASNSSMLVARDGLRLAVKLLRRCRPGVQPEVEVGEFFAHQTSWTGTPRLLGWLEHADDDPATSSTALAVIHAFAEGCVSGWDRLVELVARSGLDGPDRPRILGIVAALGRLTGEMHEALGSRPDIPAFAPAVVPRADRLSASRRMQDHARRVFVRAQASLPRLAKDVAERLDRVVSDQDGLLGSLAMLTALEEPGMAIRVHGDFHLGQVLVSADDQGMLALEFEGEPGRPLDERRAKVAAAKDVAGMCRSLDYLLRHVARTTGGLWRADDLQLLETCYLDAYREIAASACWWPADAETAARLLAIYRLDKAIYELAYELDNRPDWVEVPLAALEQACSRA